MTVQAAESENEFVIKITGIGCFIKKQDVESWLKDNGVNFKELHLGLREGDKKTVKAFLVVDNQDDSDKAFQLHESTFHYKVIHVYNTERQQLDRMLEVTGLNDCTVRLMRFSRLVTKVDIQQFFGTLEITKNGIFIPAAAFKSTCEAYVQFTNKGDAEKALYKHGHELLGSRVTITRSSVRQRELAEMRTAQQLNANTSPQKRIGRKVEDKQTTVSQLDEGLSSEKMLKLIGFAREATTRDVLEWLNEDNIKAKNVLFFSQPGNSPISIAYVTTEDESDVEKGVQKDGQFMMNRYIKVFRVTDPEIESLKLLTKVVLVTNLPRNTTEKGLFNFFNGYGARVTKTMLSEDFPIKAYIEFESPQAAEDALKKNGTQYGYNTILVTLCLTKELSDLLPMNNTKEESKSEEEEEAVKIEPNTLKLAGLKKKTSEEKIWEWFTDDDIRVASVKVQKNGFAYVTLEDEDDVQAALSKNNTKLKKRVIQVSLAKEDDEKPSPKKINVGSFGYVRMTGVSYKITEKDIRDFFGGLEIPKRGIFMETKTKGLFTGNVMVQFASPEGAVQAIKKHREYLGNRYVLIFPAKPEDWTAFTCKEVKMLPVNKPQSRSVPDGSLLYKISGLPWSAARKEVTDFFAEGGVEVKEVYLGWKDVSSGIAFVAVDEDDAVTVQRKHKTMMADRMVSVFPVNKLEFLSTMQLAESQDHFAVLKGLPHEVSAKDIVEFFHGLEIEDCGIYALPDYKGANEVVVQFKTEDGRREALKKDKCYVGSRYARIFPCKMHQLQLLATSTRVEDMTSTASLFPHFVAMKSASEGNLQRKEFQRPAGMGMQNRGERETSGESFRGFGKPPYGSEAAPWKRSSRSFNPKMSMDATPPLTKQEQKRKYSEVEVEEEPKKNTGEKKRRKKMSEGDTSIEKEISFKESNVLDEECDLENSIVKSEEIPDIPIFMKQESTNFTSGKKKKKRRSESGETSFFASSIEDVKPEPSVEVLKEEESPVQKRSPKKKKSKNLLSNTLLNLQNDKSYDIALTMADDFFRKGGGSFRRMHELMQNDGETPAETNEFIPDQVSKKKKKRRQSTGFIVGDKTDDATSALEESMNESSSRKKKKHQVMEGDTTEEQVVELSSGKKKKKHKKRSL